MEPFIREAIAFLVSNLGKATMGLFSAVICFCFPWVPGYAAGAACLYYAIHQIRPVAAWICQDIWGDLEEWQAGGELNIDPSQEPP